MAARNSSSLSFQRGKSKIFYQSENVVSSTSTSPLAMFKVSRIPSGPEEDDLPGPKRSPSHKSQDSGFSDSGGESGSGSCNGSFIRKNSAMGQTLDLAGHKCIVKVTGPEKSERNLNKNNGGITYGYTSKWIPYPKTSDTGESDDDDNIDYGFTFKSVIQVDSQQLRMAEGGSAEESEELVKTPVEKALKAHLKDTVKSFYGSLAAPLTCWLQDIRVMTELECSNMLQNKAIAKDMSHLIAMAIRNTRDNFRALKARSQIIQTKLDKIIRKFEQNKSKHLGHDLQRLNTDLTSLMRDYNGTGNVAKEESEIRSQQIVIMEGCKHLMESCKSIGKSFYDCTSLLEVANKLKLDFTYLINLMLTEELKIIIDAIETPYDKFCLRTAIVCLSKVALDSEDNCKMITKNSGLRSLLSICIDPKYCDLKIEALRSLATVCCIIEAIGQLAEIGGVECVTEILCDPNSNELEKSESAGVIAQITSPWIEHNHYIRGLSENLVNLIQSITDLAKNTFSEEVFLLAVAALANITFLDTKACYCLKNSNTPSILIDASRHRHLANSIFIKDQVATILANLVALADCRNSVTSCDGVILLLCFLQERPNKLQTEAEIDACERVQQKSAIALSRLCTDEKTAKEVVRLQGVERLVKLCRDEKERNQSDAVLVACLAALRKIAASCSMELKDAKELIEPRLLDSFLMCSSRQESFV